MNQEQVKLLIEMVSQSDMSAFHSLFTGFHPVLFRYLYVRCRDYDLARDIAQETFIRVWKHHRSLNPERSFWAFLVKISENLLKDFYKHRRVVEKHRESEIIHASQETEETGADVHFQELHQALNCIINRYLPPKCRQVFVLSRFEGHSTPEIAIMLNTSVKTVENQLYHALQIIRKKINKFL